MTLVIDFKRVRDTHSQWLCSENELLSAETIVVNANLRFVIQRHHARTLHDDFRLEHDGVFKSWALPKGMPTEVGVRRLAVQTVDHELAFGNFEGTIPDGEYGAGHIEIWDRGYCTEIAWTNDAITVVLRGELVVGRYILVSFPRGGDSAWLLFKVGP